MPIDMQTKAIIVQFGVDTAPLIAGMSRAGNIISSGVQKMSAGLGSIASQIAGLAAGAGLGALGRSVLKQADSLDALSSRLSLSVEDVSRLQFAASQTGVEFDTLARAVNKFQIGMAGAGEDSSKVGEALRNIGINPEDLVGKDPVSQFKSVLAALTDIEDPIRRIKSAGAIFGDRSAGELQKILALGPGEFNRLLAESDRIGATWSTGLVKQLDAVGDAFDRLGKVALMNAALIMAAFSGGVPKSVDDLIGKIGDLSGRISAGYG